MALTRPRSADRQRGRGNGRVVRRIDDRMRVVLPKREIESFELSARARDRRFRSLAAFRPAIFHHPFDAAMCDALIRYFGMSPPE